MKVDVVRNPVAGGGRLDTHWTEVAAALTRHFGEVEFRETTEPGDGAVLARDLVGLGCGLVVAAGGDCTISEVADGLLQMQAKRARRPFSVCCPAAPVPTSPAA